MAVLASLAGAAALSLAAAPALIPTDVPAGPQGAPGAVAEMVSGILNYTRWPDASDTPVRLCVVGPSPWAAAMADRTLVNGRALRVSHAAQLPALAQCDALFIGRIDAAQMQRTVRETAGRAIVTIEDGGDGCSFGTMFCLRQTATGMTFDLDIDAVSRGAVRVDPRVLSMGRRTGGRP
jgi:hypothetical protein